MTTQELCIALNDPEINLLADLFLDFLKSDRSTSGYRRLRNAVICASSFTGGLPSVCAALAEQENADAQVIEADIYKTLGGIDTARLFNEAYGSQGRFVKMTATAADDAVLFLSAIFAYVRYTNYNG